MPENGRSTAYNGGSASRAENGNGHYSQPHNEQTPLLKPNGDNTNGAAQQSTDAQETETTIIAEEVPFGKLALIMGVAWGGVFLGAIDSTIIATLSGPISSDFQSLSLFSWLATAYLISNAACQPISGRLTDIVGRGPGLIFSNLFFSAGNLICGLATDANIMILGRVIAGIGGGGLMSISTFLGSDLIPLRQRGIAQGIGNVCYGGGAMLGGIFGGLLNDHTKMGWRLAFLIQVPFTIVSAVAVAFLVKVPPKQSDKSFLSRIDILGVFFTVSFLVLLLLGLNSGGNVVPWTHPLPLTTIPLSFITLAGFIWWESRAVQPIIPVRLLWNRTPLAACASNLFGTMVFIASVFYVPLYLQVLGNSATKAGVLILPAPIGAAIGSMGAGFIMSKTGRYVRIGIASLVIFTSGIAIYTFQGRDTPIWLTGISFFLVGGGYGAMLTITLLACIAAVDHSQQAVITSATYLARGLGGTLGVTISSAAYQNILKARLWDRFGDYPNAVEEIRRIRDDLNELKYLPEGWYDGVMDSYMEAFRGVWFILLGISVLGLVSISCMKQHKLHSNLERRE